MLSTSNLTQAVTYHLPGANEAKLSVTWPIIGCDGPFALVRSDFPDAHSAKYQAANVTESAVSIIKQNLAYMIDSLFEVVYVKGELQSFANVWVVNQDESHQDFSLIWNYMSAESAFKSRGLPADFLTTQFDSAELPSKLALSERQQEKMCARQKNADTSELLYCLEAIQGLLSRAPNSIKVSVSEETAIGLLAIHGASAARALEGLERHPD